MAQIECFNCHHQWSLGDAVNNRCPKCGWIVEIYFDRAEADDVAGIYNEGWGSGQAGVRPLIGINGYAVSFPDHGHLAEIADRLVNRVHS
jgi:hypothetical protein